MRCACQHCGTYMVQEERGLESRCVCPACLAVCSACMGTAQEPMERGALVRALLERERQDAESCGEERPDAGYDAEREWDD